MWAKIGFMDLPTLNFKNNAGDVKKIHQQCLQLRAALSNQDRLTIVFDRASGKLGARCGVS